MTDYLEHNAVAGERWDTIAFKYYGDAKLMHHLLKANPDLIRQGPPDLVFQASVSLRVPVLDRTQADASTLPPWKRKA